MSVVEIKRYTNGDSATWNDFISKARNATFLFDRRYMDYHSDRFKDHSLLIYLRGVLSAVFVANENDDRIESHGGLTYGGLVLKPDSRMEEVLMFFYHLTKYYSASFSTISYKCLPSYLAALPSNEDLYALFALEATLVRRDAASVLERDRSLPFQKGRKSSLKKSSSVDHSIQRSPDPELFWSNVLIPNLVKRFGAKPVHSSAEMKRLMSLFPERIHLYELHSDTLQAGAVVYIMNDVVHTQYLSASEEAKENGFMDALIDHLVNREFLSISKFSFGTSNEARGKGLNLGLLNWKEGFGGRTYVHDFYEIKTSSYKLLSSYEA